MAIHELMRQTKNAYRRSVGYATDDELRSLLAERFDELAPKVRAQLAAIGE